MRFVIQALVAAAIIAAPIGAAAGASRQAVATVSRRAMPEMPVGPTWAQEGQPDASADPGFAPLSVTQSGVAYSPAAPVFDPTASDQTKIADLPAWASSYFAVGDDRRPGSLGALGGRGGLSEPIAWVLILLGMAMICGALRGLIMANRRLARLRDEDESKE